MADVIELPTAAAEPLPRRRYRGPYTLGGTVQPISRGRLRVAAAKNMRDVPEREVVECGDGSSQKKDALELLDALHCLACDGGIKGLLVVYETADGFPHDLEGGLGDGRHVAAVGRLYEDSAYAARVLREAISGIHG
jgi:hypothetical protein